MHTAAVRTLRPLARALDALFTESTASVGKPVKRLPDAIIGEVTIDHVDGHLVSTIPFVIEHLPGSVGSIVEASAHIATHDGWTAEPERAGRAGGRGARIPLGRQAHRADTTPDPCR